MPWFPPASWLIDSKSRADTVSYPTLTSFLNHEGEKSNANQVETRISTSSRANCQTVTPALFGILDSVEFEAVRIAMASQTNSDSNNFVLDMVSDVCRIEGFNVEKNVQADDSGDHSVDIIASRRPGKTMQRVAFE